jgi:hypothetical protein
LHQLAVRIIKQRRGLQVVIPAQVGIALKQRSWSSLHPQRSYSSISDEGGSKCDSGLHRNDGKGRSAPYHRINELRQSH